MCKQTETYICWLVEQQNVRLLQAEFDQDNSRLLPAAEVAHRDFMRVPFQTVLAEPVSNRLVVLLLKHVSQVLDGVLVHGQPLDKVLVVDTHSALAQEKRDC